MVTYAVDGMMYMDGIMSIMQQRNSRTTINVAISVILELMLKTATLLRLDKSFIIEVYDKANTLIMADR